MKYICTLNENINEDFVSEMSKLYNITDHLVRLLYSRGIDTQDKLKHYLNPSISDLYDPYLFEDMTRVVEKIESHIAQNHKILIFRSQFQHNLTVDLVLSQEG